MVTLRQSTSYADRKLTRDDLAQIIPPESTDTFKPIAHQELVRSIVEGLAFRHINVVSDEYAVTSDGMKLFGVLDLETTFEGCRFSLGLRLSGKSTNCSALLRPNTKKSDPLP